MNIIKIHSAFNISNTNVDDVFIIYEKVNPVIHNSIEKILNTSLSNEKNKEFLVDLYAQEMTYNLIKIKGVHEILNIDSSFYFIAEKGT